MTTYADQIVQTKLYGQLDLLIGREDVTSADVATLKGMVTKVAGEAGPLLARICETFPQYTNHDFGHVCNVIDLIYDFLPKDGAPEAVRLNAVEVTLLLLSAILHDVGMYVTAAEKQQTLASEQYTTYMRLKNDRGEAAKSSRQQGHELRARRIEDALLAEYYRRMHPERARQYIESRLSTSVNLGLRQTSLAGDVSLLCESHGWGVRESLDPRDAKKAVCHLERDQLVSKFRANLQYLACCLRLADVLDFDQSRTPLPVYEEIDFTEQKSIEEWNKHLSIQGWHVDAHGAKFRAECAHPAYYVAVHDFLNEVDAQLRECRYLLDEAPAGDERKYALTLDHLVDRRHVRMKDSRYVAGGFRFQLEYDEILRLLMDKSLYPDATLFLRELLQNSLDACRYQAALAGEADMADKYQPRITVWDYSDDAQDPRIVFQDNGIGMSQQTVENFFLRVGKSFYRSPEFDAEKQRLAAADPPIHLEACSLFGIGFLSCFLGGDRIEVETFRYGCEPLKITITGPSKYFLIERLPRVAEGIRFQSPKDWSQDGPPHYPGTRVTVHLRPGWHTPGEPPKDGIVHQTLDRFAVNQEFDIQIVRPGTPSPAIIKRWRWDDAEPLLPAASEDVANSTLTRLLIPSRVPLEEWDFSKDVRGRMWIWLLRGADGTAVPKQGSLAVETDYGVSVESPELKVVAEFNRLGLDPARRGTILEDCRTILAGSTHPDPWRIGASPQIQGLGRTEDLFKGWAHQFCKLPTKSCEDVLAALSRGGRLITPDSGSRWYRYDDLISALLNGDLGEVYCAAERLRTEIAISNLPVALGPNRLAILGVNVPAGVVRWAPIEGKSERLHAVPRFVTSVVDCHGRTACRPSASRLMLVAEEAGPVVVPIQRAVLRHLHRLVCEHDSRPERTEFYRQFVGSGRTFSIDAIVAERELLVDILKVDCVVGGSRRSLTLRAVRDAFGRFVPLISGASRDGVYTYQVPALADLPRRGRQKGRGGTRF